LGITGGEKPGGLNHRFSLNTSSTKNKQRGENKTPAAKRKGSPFHKPTPLLLLLDLLI